LDLLHQACPTSGLEDFLKTMAYSDQAQRILLKENLHAPLRGAFLFQIILSAD